MSAQYRVRIALATEKMQTPKLLGFCSFHSVTVAKMSEKESESESMKLGSEELSSEFKTLVSSDDLRSLNHLQHTILGRLQDSNAVLSHFNDFSQHCFSEISGDMGRNTRVLKSIKTDLDYIFLKLRNMKTKLLTTYPDAFPEDSMSTVIDRRPDLEMPK